MDFIIGIVTLGAFGDYELARYAKDSSSWISLGAGYASYAVMLAMYIQSIKTKGLAWSNSAWDGWSDIATNLVAFTVLGERATYTELLGMGLIAAGLFLLGNRGTK
jgi:hypothetical protein